MWIQSLLKVCKHDQRKREPIPRSLDPRFNVITIRPRAPHNLVPRVILAHVELCVVLEGVGVMEGVHVTVVARCTAGQQVERSILNYGHCP